MKSRTCQVLKLGVLLVAMAVAFAMLAGCGKSQPVSQETEVETMAQPEAENDDNQVTEPPQAVDDSQAPSPVEDKVLQGVIALETRWEGGVLTMPCTVNGLRLRFIFDTGASSVSISSTEAMFMLKNGYLDESDIGGEVQSVIANGDIVEGTEITLKTMEVGGIVLKDVEAIVSHDLEAPLLFGQSAIRQLGTIQIRDGKVTIMPGQGTGVIEDLSSDNDVVKTPLWQQAMQKGWIIESDGQWQLDYGWMAANPQTDSAYLAALVFWAYGGAAHAMWMIGGEYADGNRIPQDFTEAFRWYRMAAENGDANGQGDTGICYYTGKGVHKDKAEARRWFAMAAAQGHVVAQCFLGLMYSLGEDVSKDPFEAARWFQKAAEQGLAAAQFYLALAFERGEGVPRNLQQALYWYQQAAEQGYADALNNLALMYENGIGIDKNKQKALQLYKQAADIGSDEGEQNYRRLLREKEEYNRRVRGY